MPWSSSAPERGSALVEFALLAPAIVLLVFSALKISVSANELTVISGAVRHGARYAASAAPGVNACGPSMLAADCSEENDLPVTNDTVTARSNRAACEYIAQNGFSLAEWQVTSTISPPLDRGTYSARAISVSLEKVQGIDVIPIRAKATFFLASDCI